MIGKGVLWWAMVGRDEKHLNYASYVVPEPLYGECGRAPFSKNKRTLVRMHVQYLNLLARCVNSLVMSRDYVGSCCCFRILLLKRANQQFSI